MKKLTLAALMFAPVIVSAQTPAFTLKGTLTNVKSPVKTYLSYKQNGKNVLDSCVLSKGTFAFKGNVNGPANAQLIVDHDAVGLAKLGRSADVLNLYIDNSVIIVNATDSVRRGVITGSKINSEYDAYKAVYAAAEKKMASVDQAYGAASQDKKSDPAFRKELQSRYQNAANEKKELQQKFIKSNPASFFSLVALTEIAGSSMDVAQIEPVFKALSANVRGTSVGQEFAKQIESAKLTSVGAMAPDFTQNDENDKPVSLSSFKGKYVLIDFWASWCGPCRAENPNVVDAYNAYRDKNFTILGVSLDNPGKKDAWLAAVGKDKLAWTQVSDLNGWNNAVAKQYGIRSIPQNFLLDPSGKIVAKNLRGEELHKKLKELMGSGTSK